MPYTQHTYTPKHTYEMTADQIREVLMAAPIMSEVKLEETPEMKESLANVLKAISIQQVPGQTYVHAVAGGGGGFDERNKILYLQAHGMRCVQNLVYDGVNDAFHYQALGSTEIGYVPVLFQQKMEHMPDWSPYCPASKEVLESYFDSSQKSRIEQFREKYKRKQIHYIQLISN